MKEFYYNLKEGSKLFVSRDNDILLDFTPHRIEIRSIRNDGQVDFIDDLKRPDHLWVPAFFSEDFKRYIKFDYENNEKSQKQQSR